MNTDSMNYIYRFVKFLIKKRRVYIALSILITLGIVYYLRQNVPMKANEYVCSVALSNDGNNVGYINKDPQTYEGYRPSWQIKNPFNFENLYNQFQSTSFLNEAGDKINYRVRYTHKGTDIYSDRPFDLYVEYNSKDEGQNSFETYVEKTNDGVVLKNTKGYIDGENVKISEEMFFAYNTPKDTPIGRIIVKSRKASENWDKNYTVKVDYYDRHRMNVLFDQNMKRVRQGNIIICTLKSDYTFDFVKTLFDSMNATFVDKMKREYADEYNKYILRIDSTLATLTPETPLYKRFTELKTVAVYDYQITAKENIIEYIDKPYISEKDLVGVINTFRYFIVVFVFLLVPVFLLLIELFLRPVNINSSDLPEIIKDNVVYHVEKSEMTDIDKSNISVLLNGFGYKDLFVSSVSHRCFQSERFVHEIKDYCNINLKSCQSFDKGCVAITETVENDASLVILLNLGTMTLTRLKRLQDMLVKSKVNIFVILFE